jgi:4-hydroxy-tetrahydrodipicolinate reductase
MSPIRVVVAGATGRMGSEVARAVAAEPGFELAGLVSRKAAGGRLPGWDGVPAASTVGELLGAVRADALVDFTVAEAAFENARAAIRQGVAPVVGTSGLNPDQVSALAEEARAAGVGGAVVPNFAVGAVLMMHLARQAARFFDTVEIIELHHDGKADAPSGTALATARLLAEARPEGFRRNVPTKEALPGSRGAELAGISIHAVRLPGLVAHQEVIFGGRGQTLTIRHDSTSRESFIPGVLLAVRRVMETRQFYFGLESILGL